MICIFNTVYFLVYIYLYVHISCFLLICKLFCINFLFYISLYLFYVVYIFKHTFLYKYNYLFIHFYVVYIFFFIKNANFLPFQFMIFPQYLQRWPFPSPLWWPASLLAGCCSDIALLIYPANMLPLPSGPTYPALLVFPFPFCPFSCCLWQPFHLGLVGYNDAHTRTTTHSHK